MKSNNDKNYILTIETTSPICGVALVLDDKVIYESNLDKGLNHSITLFDNIDSALKKNKLSMKDISLIKVSNGPGSFTGLRIGIAAALGLAKQYNTPIEYIDTLDSLAHNTYKAKFKQSHIKNFRSKSNILSEYNNEKSYILSMIDARVDRVYISLYDFISLNKLSSDNIISVEELCELLNKYFKNKNVDFALIGSGAINYKDIFKKKLNINYKIYNNSDLQASSLAFTKGIKSKIPFTNYLLASKAERERKNI